MRHTMSKRKWEWEVENDRTREREMEREMNKEREMEAWFTSLISLQEIIYFIQTDLEYFTSDISTRSSY